MDHLAFFLALNRGEQRDAGLIPYAIEDGQRGWLVDQPALVRQVMVSQERDYGHPPHPFAETEPLLTDAGRMLLRLPGSRMDASAVAAELAQVIATRFEALAARLRQDPAPRARAAFRRELACAWFEALCRLLFGVELAHESAAFVEATKILERWRLEPDSVDAESFARASSSGARVAAQLNQAAGAHVSVGAIMATIFNGYAALSTTLGWTLALLVHHADALARLEQEVLASRGEALAELALERVPFAGAVVRESMRLYPPAWLLQRRAELAQPLGEQQIEPGDTLSICLYTLHRDPRFWQQGERFDPQRFMADERSDRPKHCYLPFGAGRRVCPAEQLGVGMVQRALVGLVREFSLRASGPLPRARGLISLSPESELELELELR